MSSSEQNPLPAVSEDDFRDLLDEVRRWLRRDVHPQVLALEHADEYPTAFVKQMREFGLFGATVPAQYGGMGLRAGQYAQLVAAISEVWMSLTGVINSHLMMGELIRRFGADEQRTRYLGRLAAGELRGGLALTEPDCGSDLQAIRTAATRDAGGYVIVGRKLWITNAKFGNCLAVLVKTDPEAQPRHAGMSLFLVEKNDGYVAGEKLGKLGYKGVDTTEVVFDQVRVTADQLLGGVEGSGFVQAVGALELGRINVAARGVGVARAALNAALRYANTRQTMGRPIGQHQAIALKLADMGCRVAAGELMTERAATVFDEGRRCDLEAGMAKLVATEAAMANAADAMRIHGAYGYSTEDHIERYYRDAPLLCIGEGTNEIQRVLIARHLLAAAVTG